MPPVIAALALTGMLVTLFAVEAGAVYAGIGLALLLAVAWRAALRLPVSRATGAPRRVLDAVERRTAAAGVSMAASALLTFAGRLWLWSDPSR